MREAFVGFDSAWGGHSAGAIALAVFQDEVPVKAPPPRLVGFADAAEIIAELQQECDDVLVAIDQPIIVPNDHGARPVNSVARAFMQHLNSDALDANRTETSINRAMFGDDAPIWKFIERIKPDDMTSRDLKDFDAAKTAARKTHLIEVYPALALPALNGTFMGRRSAARYNPSRKSGDYPFSSGDWKIVCNTVACLAKEAGLVPLSQWATEAVAPWDSPKKPRKLHQDKIDAAICLLVAIQWRRQSNGVCVLGDLENGYIITPTSDKTRKILKAACDGRKVPFNAVQEENDQLYRVEKSNVPTFGELLLEMPQDDLEFQRLPVSSLPLDL